MFMHTGCHSKQNGNTQQEEVSMFQCIHGADHIHVATKVASWPISNRYVVIILTMETYMQEKSVRMNQTNMDCTICPEMLLNGLAVHTLLQLISSSMIFSQTMNIMPHHRIHQ